MRVAELFNRVLDLPGARVGRVEFEDGDHPRLVVHLVRPHPAGDGLLGVWAGGPLGP
jgi:hypothetical protein